MIRNTLKRTMLLTRQSCCCPRADYVYVEDTKQMEMMRGGEVYDVDIDQVTNLLQVIGRMMNDV